MISVMEIVTDADFAQHYTVTRLNGSWVGGRFVETPTTVSFYGPIIAANEQDISVLPEGDRVNGLMVFYTTLDNPFLISRASDGQLGTSDQPNWRGNKYRILRVFDYSDYGYQKAMGTRTDGN